MNNEWTLNFHARHNIHSECRFSEIKFYDLIIGEMEIAVAIKIYYYYFLDQFFLLTFLEYIPIFESERGQGGQ